MYTWFKILAVVFIFSPSISVQALTLSEIETEIRLRIKDTHTSRQRYTSAQLTNLVNEAQRDVINNTWAIRKSTEITLIINTTYYSLPEDLIAIERVTYDRRNLPEATLISLDGESGNGAWENTGGRPQKYFQDSAQTDSIGVHPWPNSVTSTGTIRINYWAQAEDLVDATDEPFNGAFRFKPYTDLLILYPVYRVYLIEGEVDKASLYRQEYESRLAIMNERIGSKPNYNPGLSGPTTTR